MPGGHGPELEPEARRLVALGTQRQQRLGTTQRLDLRLLVETEPPQRETFNDRWRSA